MFLTIEHVGVFEYRIWHQLFVNSCSSEWSIILLMAELLFPLPVSNTIKRVKTDARASLEEKHLNSLLCISIEGPRTADFDLMLAMCLWDDTLQRLNLQPHVHYKP